MSDLRILHSVTRHALRFSERTIDTHLVDGAAHVAVTTRSGVSNPLHILAFHGYRGDGILRPELLSRTTDRLIRSDGTGAIDDAVRGLHGLARRHGAASVRLSDDAATPPAIRFRGGDEHLLGTPLFDRIGRGAVDRIDAATRRVLDFVG